MVIENKNEKSVLIISLIISILSTYCAIRGFADENLYGSTISTGVFKMAYMAGTISQDIITIISSAIMILLIVLYRKCKDIRIFISIIGLLSFYLYAYGTYVISVLYTSIYIVYMIIFTLSIFGVIMGVSGFAGKDVKRLCLPKWIRIASGAFLSLIVCIFVPMWTISMIPYTQSHTVPDFFAIFVLDLCIVMPFFIAVIYMLVRNYRLVCILLGIALLKTTTLIMSVAIGEISVSAYGLEPDIAMIAIYGVITIFSLLLFVLYLLKIRYCVDYDKALPRNRR